MTSIVPLPVGKLSGAGEQGHEGRLVAALKKATEDYLKTVIALGSN